MDELVSDEDLHDEVALKVLEGDESTLEDILHHYAPPIEKALYKKYSGLLSNADIEDILSIAIMKLWMHRQQYDDRRGSVRTYLYRIADNSAKDLIKTGWHQARRLERYSEKDFLEHTVVVENHMLQKVSIEKETPVQSRMSNATQKVLNGLPEIQRKILWADAMADGVADSAELGKKLGGHPSATIRQYRMRAKKAFREGMRKLGFEILEDKA